MHELISHFIHHAKGNKNSNSFMGCLGFGNSGSVERVAKKDHNNEYYKR